MMGNTTTDEEMHMSEDVKRMRDKVRKRFRSRVANIAMREALVSDDRMATYTDVMSEDGYIPIFIPLISLAEVCLTSSSTYIITYHLTDSMFRFQLIVFIYYCIDLKEVSLTGPVPVDSPLIFSPYKHEQLWRFISYLLIHAGYLPLHSLLSSLHLIVIGASAFRIEHIAANLLFQLVVGLLLEIVHGPIRMCIIYFAGVIAGKLGSMAR